MIYCGGFMNKGNVIVLEDMKDFYVVKHNNLVEAYYSLGCIHQKMVLLLASLVKPTDERFNEVTFKAKDLMEILGISSKNYRYLRSQTNTLAGNVIEMVLNNGKELRQAPWLSYANYSKEDNDVIVKFKLNEAIQPFILQLTGHFTKYRLSAVMTLSSSYSIRLYELLIQYLKVGERTVNLDRLKKMLAINGKKHQRYPDFRRHVLIQAQKELQEKSDICFDFEPCKNGKAVDSIKFIIKRNDDYIKAIAKKNNIENIDELTASFDSDKSPLDGLAKNYDDEFSNQIMGNIGNNSDEELIQVLVAKFGLIASEVNNLISSYGTNKLWEKYHYYHYKKDSIKNPTAWFINAVIKDYSTADMKQTKTLDVDWSDFNLEETRLTDLKNELILLNDILKEAQENLASPVCEYSSALREQYQTQIKGTGSKIANIQKEIKELESHVN